VPRSLCSAHGHFQQRSAFGSVVSILGLIDNQDFDMDTKLQVPNFFYLKLTYKFTVVSSFCGNALKLLSILAAMSKELPQ
jgi:hypothetical protein